MDKRNQPTSVWSALRKPDTGWLPRLAASLISGLALAGAGLIGTWCYAISFSRRGYVRDDDIAAGLGVAAVGWPGSGGDRSRAAGSPGRLP